MSSDHLIPRGWRYADHIAYQTPESLDDLRGPTHGTVRVEPHSNTSPHPVDDLSDPEMVWHLYSAVVRDGTAQEQAVLLDRETLPKIWHTLNLPVQCRQLWESQFPERTGLTAGSGV